MKSKFSIEITGWENDGLRLECTDTSLKFYKPQSSWQMLNALIFVLCANTVISLASHFPIEYCNSVAIHNFLSRSFAFVSLCSSACEFLKPYQTRVNHLAFTFLSELIQFMSQIFIGYDCESQAIARKIKSQPMAD